MFVDDDFMFDDMKLNAEQLQMMNMMQGQFGSAILGLDYKWDGRVMLGWPTLYSDVPKV